MHSLYQITNLINSKYYIGVHICGVQCARHRVCPYMGSGTAVKAAIKKYGRENFRRDMLAETSDEKFAFQLEAAVVTQEFVDQSTNYNCKVGGFGGWSHRKGTKHSPETLAKMRAIKLGKRYSEETRQKQRLAKLGTHYGVGRKMSDAARANMSIAAKKKFAAGYVQWNKKVSEN